MIVPMKKAKLVVMKDDKEKLLRSLQKAGVFMPIPTGEAETAGDASKEEALLQKTDKSLKLVERFREKKGFIRPLNLVGYDDFIKVDPEHENILTEIEETDARISHLENENQALEEQIKYYLPWKDLNIRLSDLNNTKYSVFHTGFQMVSKINDLKLAVLEAGGEIVELGMGPDGMAFVFANYFHDDIMVMEKAKSLGFLEVSLPKIEKFALEVITEKEKQISKNLQEIENLTQKLSKFAQDVKEIELFNDQLASIKALKKAPLKMTLETVYLEGWVRSDQVELFEKSVVKAVKLYELELSDPDAEDNPPTYTKNNRFVRPFEAITDMFARPKITDVDPNPVMSIWFWFIFGMMMGDVGYGLLMFIIFFALIKIKRPKGDGLKLFKLLLYSSITTVFWGVMFGSYFGYALYPAIFLEPMVDLTKYLIFSFVIGGLHVISGILVAAYANIKEGKLLDALFDQFSWVILLVGLGFLFLPELKNIGLALALTGGVIILLTAGRQKKNIFGKIFGGFASLYNVTGYASDILSYSRIMALSLSTAVIAYVMNLLAEMVMGNFIGYFFAALIYFVGHIFNLLMGLLSAYVHDSRLQYIEFFGKFYEGGGEKFSPLTYKLKYIDQVNDRNATKQEVI
jgi:V/A-type H+-transporting ATPase subunit I